MHWKHLFAVGLAGLVGATASAQPIPDSPGRATTQGGVVARSDQTVVPPARPGTVAIITPGTPVGTAPVTPPGTAKPGRLGVAQADQAGPENAAQDVPLNDPGAPAEGQNAAEALEDSETMGPYPIQKMTILQNWLRKCCGKPPLKDEKPKKKDDCNGKKPADSQAAKKDEGPAPPKKDEGPAPPPKDGVPPKDGMAKDGTIPDSAPSAAVAPGSGDPNGGNAPSVDCGDDCKKKKDPCLKIFGWIDNDYTYRSTGPGNNAVAPVMNHYGDEFLNRQNGILISKVLDQKTWSWGFNAQFILGSDAAFLNPTKGWFRSTNLGPGGSDRYSCQFTDLNLTGHLPILTEGGVDVKVGRQTTILGPMGAMPWQRFFDSSDYAWYNMEEGRYTGGSAVWHINKRLDWYNGFELGWGTFFAQIGNDVDYITNISYWLDPDAKKTRIWSTVLTGPTSLNSGANTTVAELGWQNNWNRYWYQIIDSQMVWSKGPVNQPVPPNYNERAYDVYTYIGRHLTRCLDLNSRWEWYKDVDGMKYAGGFGKPHTDYYECTIGFDWHPKIWMQFRPEIRYDHATNPNFGQNYNQKAHLSIAADLLIKF